MSRVFLVGIAAAVLGLASGCAPADHARHGHGFPPPARGAADVDGAERWTVDLATVPHRFEKGEDREFLVAARRGELTQAPCRRCHAKPLEEARAALELPEKAHWQIRRAHGAAELSCGDCHETPGSMELRSSRGEPLDFDHSYRLCASCHFEQAEDWVGGAHGKRLASWAGERVVQSCTGCHDPHEPGFEKRLPATSAPSPEKGRS